MDKKRRKELRRIAQAQQRQRAERVAALHRDAGLAVPISDPTWMARFRNGRERERWARTVRSRALGRDEVVANFVLRYLGELADGDSPLSFAFCTLCGDVISAKAVHDLTCSCRNLRLEVSSRGVLRVHQLDSAVEVDLIGRGVGTGQAERSEGTELLMATMLLPSRWATRRHIGALSRVSETWRQLLPLAERAGLWPPRGRVASIFPAEMPDEPEEKCLIFVGIEIGADDPVPEGFELVSLPGGECVSLVHRGSHQEVERAWTWHWNIGPGAVGRSPRRAPLFEAYLGDPPGGAGYEGALLNIPLQPRAASSQKESAGNGGGVRGGRAPEVIHRESVRSDSGELPDSLAEVREGSEMTSKFLPGDRVPTCPEGFEELPFTGQFTAEQFARIRKGFRARVMEEKWDMTFVDEVLVIARSWSGFEIYRVEFRRHGENYVVFHACVNRRPEQYGGMDTADEVRSLKFLIDRFLLRRGELPGGEVDDSLRAHVTYGQLPAKGEED